MKSSLMATIALCTPLLASLPQTKTLQLYPNASFLSYDFKVKNGEFSTKIPDFVNLQNLTLQSGCVVEKSTILKTKNSENDAVKKKIESLQEKQEELSLKYQSFTNQKRFLDSIKINLNSLDNIQKDTQKLNEVYLKNLQNMLQTKKELEKIQKELSKILNQDKASLQNEFKAWLNCPNESSLKLSFPLNGIKVQNVTRFDANINENSLKITQKIFLNHNLDDLLKDINIRLYSFAYNSSLEPNRFYPYYLHNYSRKFKKRTVGGSNKEMALESVASQDKLVKSSSSRKIGLPQNLSTKRIWDVKNVTLFADKENEVVFNTQVVKAEYENFVDGYGSVKAYLKAKFKPSQYIVSSQAKFMLDGALIGKRYVKELIKNEESNLYFGQNNFIQIQKELLEKMSDKSFFGTSKNTKTLWKYTITNKSEKPQKISLSERLPISQDDDIKVERLGDLKPLHVSKQGEVVWNFELKSKNKKEFTFGYDIKRPMD